MGRSEKRRWFLIALLIAPILVGGGYYALRSQARTPEARRPPEPAAERQLPTPTMLPPSPTPTPTRIPPETVAISHTVRYGETLTGIAAAYGTTVEQLLRLNPLTDPDHLQVGQVLNIALDVEREGPAEWLIPDSEMVYGPGYADFAVEAMTNGGLLAVYAEDVAGEMLTGPEIVQRVAEQYSVGPRVLLTLLEVRGGWLTDEDPPPESRRYPLGYTAYEAWDGLYLQLCLAANALNGGFYGWWLDETWLIPLGDGSYVRYAPAVNAGTAGVQRALARGAADYAAWVDDLQAFARVYRQFFGDPFAYAVEPLLPHELTSPELALPWPVGETWYFTGGPHPGWGTLGAWAALDFVPDERDLGCRPARAWVTAAAPGRVLVSRTGEVLQELDDDGFLGTGWVLLYMHVASEGRVREGTWLRVGDRVGHPSCEGGVANASHLHIARRYNGVWIPAHDPRWPMRLSGWLPTSDGAPYEGTLVKGDEVRVAEEDWLPLNAVLHAGQ